jgi:hypothetical protein
MPSDQQRPTSEQYEEWEASLETFLRLTGSIVFSNAILFPHDAGPMSILEALRDPISVLRQDIRSVLIPDPPVAQAPTREQLSLVDDAGLPFDPLGELPVDEGFPEPTAPQALTTRPTLASLILSIFKSATGIVMTSRIIFRRLENDCATFSEMDRQPSRPSSPSKERWRVVASDALKSLWLTHPDIYRLDKYTYIYAPSGTVIPSCAWAKA